MSLEIPAKKSADTAQPLHPLLQERWSPRAFIEGHRISEEDLQAILEAGRWSPSSNNFQPWRFFVAKHGHKIFELISETLAGFNREWAPKASAYIVLNAVMVDDLHQPRNQSLYDVGIASAYMTIEANHRGLAVHQIGGFDREAVINKFNLGKTISPIAILVLGKQAPADSLIDNELAKRERSSRVRKSLSELILASD